MTTDCATITRGATCTKSTWMVKTSRIGRRARYQKTALGL